MFINFFNNFLVFIVFLICFFNPFFSFTSIRAEEEARYINKPDPKAAEAGTNVQEIQRQGRLRHTGRWIPVEVLQYTNKRGHRVVRKPQIHVPGFGMVDNVLDDIPDGIAHNAYQRGLLEPEMA